MRSTRSRLSVPAAITAVAALLVTMFTVPGVAVATETNTAPTSAPASQERVTSALSDGEAIVVGITGDGALALASRGADGALVDPSGVLRTVPGTDAVDVTLATDITVPEGYTATSPVSLTLVEASGPESATVRITDPANGARLVDTTSENSSGVEVTLGEPRVTRWQFGTQGRYTLSFQASLSIADTAGTVQTVSSDPLEYAIAVGEVVPVATTTALTVPDAVESGTVSTLTASVTPAASAGAVEFFDGEALLGAVAVAEGAATLDAEGLGDGAHELSARFVPTWSTDFAPSGSDAVTLAVGSADSVIAENTLAAGAEQQVTQKSAAAAPLAAASSEVRVLSSGDVRFADRLVDGSLDLGLRDVTDAGAAEWWDPASTVLHVAVQDSAWGGEGTRKTKLERWKQVSDEGSLFWSTNTSDQLEWPGNSLIVDVDAGLVPTSAVAGDPEFTFGGAETESGGYFVLLHGAPVRAWDSRDGLSDAVSASTTEKGDGVTPALDGTMQNQLTFSAEGVYYLTVSSSVWTSAGEELTDTAVYTVVVGDDVDPATVTPAPQPGDDTGNDDDLVRDDGVAILDSGDVRFSPTVTDGELGVQLAAYAGTQETLFTAQEAVLYLPKQDAEWPGEALTTAKDQSVWNTVVPRGVKPWRTSGYIGQSHAYYENELLLSLDGSLTGDENGVSTLSLQSANGPGNATSYRVGSENVAVDNTLIWDAAAPDEGETLVLNDRGPGRSGTGDTGYQRSAGWAFTEAGTYCVTLRAGLDEEIAAATFTVVVGAETDPRTTALCAQEEVHLPDSGDDGDQDLDPTITYLDLGHTDFAVDVVDGKTAIGGDFEKFYDLDDLIWVGQSNKNEYIVPSPTASRDYTFIAPAGTPYWGFSQSPNPSVALWPGLSLQGIGYGEILQESLGSITLLGVSGPGDVVIFDDNAGTGLRDASAVYWSTRQGYPQSRSFERGNHSHMNWAFTAQGVYCLNWQATLRLPDGTDSTATEQLTVVVGQDVDLSSVQPCGRNTDTPAPVGTVTTPTTLATDPTLLTSGQALISPYLDADGEAQVFARVQGSPTEELVNRDVESLIFSAGKVQASGYVGGDDGWWSGWAAQAQQPDISWDTTWLDAASLSGDPTISIGDVTGPGDVRVLRGEWIGAGNRMPEGAYVAIDTADDSPDETTLRAGWRERHVVHSFTDSGVYCVPVTWEIGLAGGGTTSVTKTLTFVAGSTNPSDESYVDRSAVTPCAQGGEATEPGDDDGSDDPGETPDDPDENVPDSDAIVLSQGHIDIASVVEDGKLVTKVKDDTTDSDDLILRDTGDVVLHVTPPAETTVPSSDAGEFDFLGAEGTKFWLLPATQNSLLLWPGWSTELIERGVVPEGVQWTLTDIEGPGEFALYESGEFGVPIVRWNTRDGVTAADSFTIDEGLHAHGNWAFSAEGTYCLAFDRTATIDGKQQTVSSTLAIAVGNVNPQKIDPADCFTEPDGEPEDPDATPTVPGDLDDDNAGSIQILGNDEGFTAGQLITVQVDKARAGEWVSLWLDGQTWLGWLQVSSSGAVQVRLPSGAAVGSHTLQVNDRDGKLLGWDSLSIVAAKDPGDGSDGGTTPPDDEPAPEPDAVWEVGNGTVNNAGATVLNNGHIDIASLLDGSALTTTVKDTTQSGTPVWRDTAQTVLQLLPNARTTVPRGSAWSFLGTAGSSFYQVSQTQQAGLLWPGWSTEAIPTSATETGVDWTLTDISGPGEFALYETGAFGEPTILFNTRDGLTENDSFEIPKNTHAHGSWAFSAQGNYCLAFDRTTTLVSGAKVTTSFILAVAVGRADVMSVDPARCFQDEEDKPQEKDTTPVSDDDIDEAKTGTVRVLDADAGFTTGQLISAQLGTDHANEWVSAWLHPTQGNADPEWLGWVKTDANGILRVRLPADADPGDYRLVIKDAAGSLIGWDGIRIAAAADDDGGKGGTAPVDDGTDTDADGIWDVANGTVNEKGATVLTTGHVDIASTLAGSALDTKVKDTTQTSDPVWRDPEKTVLQVRPEARTTVPDNSAYSFLGATGSSFYQVSQVQQDGLLWPGWSTESIPADATTGGVAWTLTDLSGPGEFALYETDSFGQPSVLFNTRDGITSADSFTIPKITHAHGSWAFSAEGTYCLAMQRTTQLSSGQTVSDSFVLAIAVGTADVMRLDPAACGEDVDTGVVDVAAPTADATDAVPAAQALAAQQCVAGATVLSSGHIDYSSRIVDGKLQSLVGDDTSGTKVYREPSGTILWLKPSSAVTLPAGYGSVGSAGSQVWQIPQTQQSGLIWVGWSTESLNAGNTASSVSWTVNSVDGPGSMKVYLTGSFGGVQQMIFNNGGNYQIPLGVHAHANWAFSAEGVYRINTTQTATLANGQTTSDTETLTIVVGNVDPASAAATSGSGCGTVSNALLLTDDTEGTLLAADQAAAEAAEAAAHVRPGQASDAETPGIVDPFTALAQGNPVPLLLSILGILLLVGAVGSVVAWRRSRSRRREQVGP